MATLSLPIPDSNFANGQTALGTDVLAQDKAIVTFLNSQNMDSANINVGAAFPWTARHSWSVSDASNDNLSLVVGAVMATSKFGFHVSSAQAQVNSALVFFEQTSASTTSSVLSLATAGTGSVLSSVATGDAIAIEANSATSGNTKSVIKAIQSGTGHLVEGELRGVTGLNAVVTAKVLTTPVTVNNTATETVVTGLVLNLPANFLKAGTTIHGKVRGVMSTPGAAPATSRVRVFYGTAATPTGTALLDSGAITPVVNLANDIIELDFSLTCLTTGASGTVEAQGTLYWNVIASSTAGAVARGMGTAGTGKNNTAAITIDTTATNDIYISFVWGSAVSGCTVSFRQGYVEVLR